MFAAEYLRALASLGEIERSLQVPITAKDLEHQHECFYDHFTKMTRSIPKLDQNCFFYSYDGKSYFPDLRFLSQVNPLCCKISPNLYLLHISGDNIQ